MDGQNAFWFLHKSAEGMRSGREAQRWESGDDKAVPGLGHGGTGAKENSQLLRILLSWKVQRRAVANPLWHMGASGTGSEAACAAAWFAGRIQRCVGDDRPAGP